MPAAWHSSPLEPLAPVGAAPFSHWRLRTALALLTVATGGFQLVRSDRVSLVLTLLMRWSISVYSRLLHLAAFGMVSPEDCHPALIRLALGRRYNGILDGEAGFR